jgi:hypothetical protein
MTRPSPGAELRKHLDRWVAEGLIDTAQATRIETAETPAAGSPAGRPPAAGSPAAGSPAAAAPATGSRAPLVAEALGYAGGVLAIAAGLYLVRDFWPHLSTGAVLAFAAAACAALGAGGAAVRATSDPALRRLRSVLWLLSTVSLAAFAGTLADQVWGFGPASTTLVTAAVSAAYGAALWRRTRAVLQHLAVFASLAVLAGTVVARLDPGLGAWGPGLAIWALSVLWGVAVMRGYLPPGATGYFAPGVGVLAGAQLTMQVAAGYVLALATVAGLLAAGVLLRQAWLVVLGALGVLLVTPQVATRYLPMSAATPVAIFVVGVVLVGSAVWLARRRAGSQ